MNTQRTAGTPVPNFTPETDVRHRRDEDPAVAICDSFFIKEK
jgi:hypothetical protein